jgi:tRNA threonylcarbamoyl adenosine modification protein YeaZ
LLKDGRIVASRHEEMGRGQAERLFPMLEEVLGDFGAVWQELDAIAVGTGPGNFTGIRIAVSAARGLALSLGIPAIGIDGFTVLRAETGLNTVALPAPRGQVYLKTFAPREGEPRLVEANGAPPAPAVPGNPAAAIARLASHRLASGDPGPRPAPLYIRPADAAPASDPPPVILP